MISRSSTIVASIRLYHLTPDPGPDWGPQPLWLTNFVWKSFPLSPTGLARSDVLLEALPKLERLLKELFRHRAPVWKGCLPAAAAAAVVRPVNVNRLYEVWLPVFD